MTRPPDAGCRPAARTGAPVRALRAVAAAAALLAAPAAAQQPPSGEAALSPECRVPTGQLYTVAPLPAVRAALAAGRPLKVLAVGGSAAPGASASYPAKLEAALEASLPKVDVLIEHRGLPGEIASGAAERLHTLVADVEPDLVVWQVGTHDAMARVDPEVFVRALDEAVAWLKSHGIDVVLVDPLYTASVAGDADYNRIVAAVRDVAARERVPLVQRFEALRYLAGRSGGGEGHMLGRQFRLNDLGLRCMAEHVALTVASALHTEPHAGPAKAEPSKPDPAKPDPANTAPTKTAPANTAPALTAPQRAPG